MPGDDAPTRVGILLFDDVQVTDFTGPYDVFTMARPPGAGVFDAARLFEVFTVAERREVRCFGGLRVTADYGLDDHPPIELLVVPGGLGTRREDGNQRLLDWIARVAAGARLTTSVCTGSRLLARVGLLDGRRATCHWLSLDYLRDTFPAVEVVSGVRYVDAGEVVTSAGVSAGLDMALHVVRRLHGPAVANETARTLEYDYWEGLRAAPATS